MVPVLRSVPAVDIRRPIRSEIMPLSGDPAKMMTAQLSPRAASQKYSSELKFAANRARSGAPMISTTVANSPPRAEKIRQAARPRAPSPRCVIRYRSST